MSTIGNSFISINNVWLVDGMKHNLLSISQFCGSGYEVMFDKKNYTITGSRKDNVYKINFSDFTDQKVVCLLSVSDEKWLCHKHLGHAGWRLISKLIKLKLVKGLSELK